MGQSKAGACCAACTMKPLSPISFANECHLRCTTHTLDWCVGDLVGNAVCSAVTWGSIEVHNDTLSATELAVWHGISYTSKSF